MWPNFRTPLLVGRVRGQHLLHRLAALLVHRPDPRPRDAPRPRDDARSRASLYGIFALGWRGSTRHWHHYESAYLILAALSHAAGALGALGRVVRLRRRRSLPGWHTTIFPPYFVAGAIFGGFAMVLTLLIPARQVFGLKDIITIRHIENMNKIILATGRWSVTPTRWSSSSPGTAATRTSASRSSTARSGPYAWAYWTMITLQRHHPAAVLVQGMRTQRAGRSLLIGMFVNIGMWFERFVIIVHLAAPRLPAVAAGATYVPTMCRL